MRFFVKATGASSMRARLASSIASTSSPASSTSNADQPPSVRTSQPWLGAAAGRASFALHQADAPATRSRRRSVPPTTARSSTSTTVPRRSTPTASDDSAASARQSAPFLPTISTSGSGVSVMPPFIGFFGRATSLLR